MENTTPAFLLNFSESDALQNNSISGGEVTDISDNEALLTAQINELSAHLAMTRFVVQRILTPMVVIFGVVGNFVNIVVLTRRWMKSSTNCYLTALALYDILYLVFALTMSFHHYPSIKSQPSYIRYKYLFGKPLTDTFSNTGVWLTLTFTIERYIGVCLPMKGKRWCTPQRARIITVAVCIISALITFPEFFEFNIVSEVNSDNITIVRPEPSEFGSKSSYSMGYVYTNQALFTLLPLILLFVFNSLLIRAVMHAAQQRKSMAKVNLVKSQRGSTAGTGRERPQRNQSDQHKITIMLIIVVIVFLICQLPQAIQKLYVQYSNFNSNDHPLIIRRLTITANIFNLLVMLNASTNFILYSCFSTKFRRTFNRLFCQCLRYGSRSRLSEALFTDVTATGHHSPPDERGLLASQSVHGKQPTSGRSSGQWTNARSDSNVCNKIRLKNRNICSGLRETVASTRQQTGLNSAVNWTANRQNGYPEVHTVNQRLTSAV